MTTPTPRRGSYGIDAPVWIPILALAIAANVVNAVIARSVWAWLPVALLACCAGISFHTTLRGKFAVWARLLDDLPFRGDERVLDLGCGRGAVLLLAAER